MEGKECLILTGLERFSIRCKKSMKRVVFKFKETTSDKFRDRFKAVTFESSETLKVLDVGHQGDLSRYLGMIATRCPSLSTLSSYRLGFEKELLKPDMGQDVLRFPRKLSSQLKSLTCTCGCFNLVCDEFLLDLLKGATRVNINSSELTPSWAVKLLTSNPSLVEVRLRWSKDEEVEEIPELKLSNIRELFLGKVPRSKLSSNGSLFVQNLDSPRLNLLHLVDLNPRDLLLLRTGSVPEQFILNELLVPKDSPSILVKAMKDWKRLHCL